MNTRGKYPKGLAGEVSLRLLLAGAARCGGLYLFRRPKPAPPVVEDPPALPATQAPAPAIVQQAPAPGIPPPTEPVANKAAPPAVGKIPELRVQAAAGTSQKRSGSSSYMKEQTSKPKCVIVGASQMSAIPALEATMVVVTMGTMAK